MLEALGVERPAEPLGLALVPAGMWPEAPTVAQRAQPVAQRARPVVRLAVTLVPAAPNRRPDWLVG